MALITELLGRSPTARRALDLLASAPGHEFHTREIARRVSADPHSAQLALDHLLQAGAVTSRRVGNLRLWSLDATSKRVESIRSLLRHESRVTGLLSEGLGRMSGVRVAVIFGSFASGEDKSGSDIDVLIIGEVDWDRLARLSETVTGHVRRDVNFVVWSDAELSDPKPGQRRLLNSIISRPRIVLKGSDDDLIGSSRRLTSQIRERRDRTRGQSEQRKTEARPRGDSRKPRKRPPRAR